MQFYLKPVMGADTLFVIMDHCGRAVYEVTARPYSLGRRYYLVDTDCSRVARISCVRLSVAFQYSITVGRQHLRMTVDFSSQRRPVKFRGKRWRFRGNATIRSFDILNENSQVIMTHGRCWGTHGDCYAMELKDPSRALLCLCVAVAIDSTVQSGLTSAVPAG